MQIVITKKTVYTYPVILQSNISLQVSSTFKILKEKDIDVCEYYNYKQKINKEEYIFNNNTIDNINTTSYSNLSIDINKTNID